MVDLKYFEYSHLPEKLQKASAPFHSLAVSIADLPQSEEQQAGLRKLLEAKDCIVRAFLDIPED